MALAHLLDDRIDLAASDGTKMVPARVFTVVVNIGLLLANFNFAVAMSWGVAVLGFEFGRGVAARRIAEHGGNRRTRLLYLVSVAGMSAGWTALSVICWMSERPALMVYSTALLSNQLIHTLAFTFRSPPIRIIAGGLPAAAMIILPTFFGNFSGIELATVGFGIALALFYVAAAIRANLDADVKLRAAQDELEHFAYFDALTMLANRRLFTEHLRRLIALSRRRGTRFALLLIDLDEFKLINDTLGHDAGDALLVEVGARLRRAVRDSDHVARLGGDEFAILLPEAHDSAEVLAVCERIRDSFATSIEFNGSRMTSSPSVGVAMFPDDGDGQESLYKSADLALYAAKREGRNTWRYGASAQTLIMSA